MEYLKSSNGLWLPKEEIPIKNKTADRPHGITIIHLVCTLALTVTSIAVSIYSVTIANRSLELTRLVQTKAQQAYLTIDNFQLRSDTDGYSFLFDIKNLGNTPASKVYAALILWRGDSHTGYKIGQSSAQTYLNGKESVALTLFAIPKPTQLHSRFAIVLEYRTVFGDFVQRFACPATKDPVIQQCVTAEIQGYLSEK